MEITGIRVRLVDEPKLKAFASLVFDDCFMINDLKVIQGKGEEYFVSMPNRKRRNGKYRDVAHPLNSETREWIQDAVVAEYLRVLKGEGADEPDLTPRPSNGSRKKIDIQEIANLHGEDREPEAQATLEEIQKKHLQDSFWSV